MDIDWKDPRIVSLHERLAACAQSAFEESLTASGAVADSAYLGRRIAVDILTAAVATLLGPSTWSITFTADPAPNPNAVIGCVACGATEGRLHDEYCHRSGILRRGEAVL